MLFRSNDTATTEIYTDLDTLSLHDALPISPRRSWVGPRRRNRITGGEPPVNRFAPGGRSAEDPVRPGRTGVNAAPRLCEDDGWGRPTPSAPPSPLPARPVGRPVKAHGRGWMRGPSQATKGVGRARTDSAREAFFPFSISIYEFLFLENSYLGHTNSESGDSSTKILLKLSSV